MVARFEILDHTADVGIVAHGRDLPELFGNAAYGMFSVMAHVEGVKGQRRFIIQIGADDLDGLLVEWLNELLYLWETENVLLTEFGIDEVDEHGLRGWAQGAPVDLDRHQLKLGIKAVTYHQLQVEREDGYRAQVIFDI